MCPQSSRCQIRVPTWAGSSSSPQGSLVRGETERATLHPVSKQHPFLRQRCCLCRLFAPRLLLPLLGLPPMMKFGLQHPLPPVPAGLGED